jgi:hypothetical protein
MVQTRTQTSYGLSYLFTQSLFSSSKVRVPLAEVAGPVVPLGSVDGDRDAHCADTSFCEALPIEDKADTGEGGIDAAKEQRAEEAAILIFLMGGVNGDWLCREQHAHWTLTKRCDLPPGTKIILSIWSFKQKWYPDGTLNKHKACLLHMEACRNGVKIIDK